MLSTKAEYERFDAILAGTGVGRSPAFISSCYTRASRNLIANFEREIKKLSIGLVLALYVAFGDKSFVKVVLFTQELANHRLDGLLTLGDLFVLLSYPEQLQGPRSLMPNWRQPSIEN